MKWNEIEFFIYRFIFRRLCACSHYSKLLRLKPSRNFLQGHRLPRHSHLVPPAIPPTNRQINIHIAGTTETRIYILISLPITHWFLDVLKDRSVFPVRLIEGDAAAPGIKVIWDEMVVISKSYRYIKKYFIGLHPFFWILYFSALQLIPPQA